VSGLLAVALITTLPGLAAAQERFALRPLPTVPTAPSPAPPPPASATSSPMQNLDFGDDPVVAAKRIADKLSERLRPIETRLRRDARLRRAGALVGLAAIAMGALHGDQSLTFVGTEAIRLGLQRQLGAVRARTGFAISPSLGDHSISVIVSRTFP